MMQGKSLSLMLVHGPLTMQFSQTIPELPAISARIYSCISESVVVNRLASKRLTKTLYCYEHTICHAIL